jgi:hypothetical protein
MNTFNTGGWDWGHSDYSEAAVGDSGPWIWWLPLAWRAVSDPGGPHPLPPPPGPADWGEGEHPSEHPETLAWWTPLFHLLLFGLGWVRPDLGLARWIEHGRPDQDPVLRVVNRWWGENVTDVLAWSARNDVLRDMAAAAAGEDGGTLFPCELPDRWAERRRSLEWRRVWGTDNDSMHLGGHGITPVWGPEPQRSLLATAPDGRSDAVLVLRSYEGWYATLREAASHLPSRADGRSWRVNVVVEPLGSLGVYRRSRQTGRWFSGRHRWHQLGVDQQLP